MPTKTGASCTQRSNRLVAKGGVIQPSSQVLLFNPDQWEEFILAATRQRVLASGNRYAFVKRLGGSGDGGRDIEARFDKDLKKDEWDFYQAKHYDHGLTQGNAYPEMANFFKQLALKTYPHEPEFERLLAMVYAGIRPTVTQLKLKSGMDRLDAAVDKVSSL